MQAYERSQLGTMGREAKRKLNNDNDIKILIVGANSSTGIGKTTLAIQVCRFIDDDWSVDEKAFIDINEYLNRYLDVPGGSALLLDEIEHGADSRRSTSKENVNLSQGWAKLRARNVATVATIPSISMLDKRMTELADYWVLVKERGLAKPHRVRVNDFAPGRRPQKQPLPGDEHIQFVDLPDDDPDKEYLDRIKDDIVRSEGPKTIYVEEHKEKLERAKDAVRDEMRNEILKDVYEHTTATQSDLSNCETLDWTQGTINQKVVDIDPVVSKNRAIELRNQALVTLDEYTDLQRVEMADLRWVDISPSTIGRIINNAG